MNVFWLGLQCGIFGVADLFTFVGLLEFFYAESSGGTKSLDTAIYRCSQALGYLSSVLVEVENKANGTNNLKSIVISSTTSIRYWQGLVWLILGFI